MNYPVHASRLAVAVPLAFLPAGVAVADFAGFAPKQQYEMWCAGDVHAVDLTGNGLLDFIGAHKGCTAVLLANCDGTFGPQMVMQTSADSLSVVDLNGNGVFDLVMTTDPYYSVGTIAISMGNGDGTFQPVQTLFTQPRGWYLQKIAAGDLNGNGAPDLVATMYNDFDHDNSVIVVLLADGKGGFAPAQTYPAGPVANAVKLADLDDDGALDVIVLNKVWSLGAVSILLGNGDGTLQPRQAYPVGYSPVDIAIGDLNANGSPDLVVANLCCYEDDRLALLFSQGDGTFFPSIDLPTGRGPMSVAVGDVNGNGLADIAVSYWFEYDLAVHFNQGGSSFGPPQYLNQWWGYAYSTLLVDVAGNGVLDIVIAGEDFAVLFNQTEPAPRPADLNGDGVVDVSDLLMLLSAWGECACFVCPVDINHDGTVDVSDLLALLENWG